jgi:hypothetical protein
MPDPKKHPIVSARPREDPPETLEPLSAPPTHRGLLACAFYQSSAMRLGTALINLAVLQVPWVDLKVSWVGDFREKRKNNLLIEYPVAP